MTMEYIPNALAFIFVVNVVNAGGLQDDRVRSFLETIIDLIKLDSISRNNSNVNCVNGLKKFYIVHVWLIKLKLLSFFYIVQFTKGKYDFNTILHLPLRKQI